MLVSPEMIVGGMQNPLLPRVSSKNLHDRHTCVICLVWLIYNHSYKPNAIYEDGLQLRCLRPLRNIEPDENSGINYPAISYAMTASIPTGRVSFLRAIVEFRL